MKAYALLLSVVAPLAALGQPVITTQPAAQTVAAGANATLSVTATGTPPLSYQWRKAGVAISGATAATYTIPGVQSAQVGVYDVVVTDAGGSRTSQSAGLTLTTGTVPSAGLVFHYALQGDTRETRGASDLLFVSVPSSVTTLPDDAAYTAPGVFGAGRAGQVNGALTFDGVTKNYARLPVPVDATVANDYTLSVWAYAEGTKPLVFFEADILLMAAHGSVNYGGGHAATGLVMNRTGVGLTAHSDNYPALLLTADFQAGLWHHLVVTCTGKVFRLYVDGVLRGTSDQSGAPYTYHPSAGDPYRLNEFWIPQGGGLGGWIGHDGVTYRGFTGRANDFRLYNRGLAADEVQQLYAAEFSGINASDPRILSSPQSQAVFSGSPVTFTVTAAGTAPLSYQWRKDGTAISGATAASHTIASVQLADAGNYDVVVTGPAGSVTAIAASLAVSSPPNPSAGLAAHYTFDGSLNDAGPGGLHLTAGTGVLSYVADRLGNAGAAIQLGTVTPGQPFLSGTGPNLANRSSSVAFWVRKEFTGEGTHVFGLGEGQAGMGMHVALDYGGSPLRYSFYYDDFTTPNSVPAYQWAHVAATFDATTRERRVYLNGVLQGTNTAAYGFSGSTALAFGHPGISLDDFRLYDRTLTAAEVTLLAAAPATPAAPVILTAPQSQTVAAGAPATFTVAASGDTPLSYQWRKGGTAIPGATAATYTLAVSAAGDSGNYDVIVTNSAGSATSGVATLTVTPSAGTPAASLQLVGAAYYLSAGGTLTLQAGITYAGLTPTALGYALTLPEGFSLVSVGGTNVPNVAPAAGSAGVLEFAYSTLPADAASFSVVVAYAAGLTGTRTFSATATYRSPLQSLTVAPVTLSRLDPPVITTPPAGGVFRAGSSLTLTVVASSGVAPSYQWRRDGTPLSGATSASLSLLALQPGQAGTYTVTVANPVGETVSAAAQVHVLEVQATQALSGAGYVAGGTVTVTNTLTFSPALTSLSWEVLPPTGWTYASGAGAEGTTRPAVGAADLLTWTWSPVPASPVSFSYTLNVPAGTTGDKNLSTLVRPGLAAGALQILASPEPLQLPPAAFHSADTNRDQRLSLVELTRVIELYNTRQAAVRTGAYRVQEGSEDGFAADGAPVTGAVLPRFHSADLDRNGRLNLLELTRVIELFNTREAGARTGRYSSRPGSEDGFAPGA